MKSTDPANHVFFQVGKSYRRADGLIVTIVARNELPSYKCAQGDDISETTGQGIWRYNRASEKPGRVTGSPHDFSDPRNLLQEEVN